MSTTTDDTTTSTEAAGSSWVKHWTPDGRWLHPLVAVVCLYLVGWLPAWGVPPWVMACVGVAGGLGGWVLARMSYPAGEYGTEHALSAAWLAGFSGVAAAAWLVYAGVATPVRSAGWLLLGGVIFGGWYALVRSKAEGRAERMMQSRTVEVTKQTGVEWKGILAKSGLPGMVVQSITETRAGYTLAVQPNQASPKTFDEVSARTKAIALNASFVLAQQGITLREADVRIEPTEAAHVYLIHVSTKRVLAQSVPYVAAETPQDIRLPRDFGLYEDGHRMAFKLAGTHGKAVGATGSGKSVFANVFIGRVTECSNALLWVAATDKLTPLVYPWLHPWFAGQSSRSVVDWVAGQSPNEALKMLACAYRVMRERNGRLSHHSKHVPTVAEPDIEILLEEASDMLQRRDTIATYDGRRMTASELVSELGRSGRSASVSIKKLTQFGLYDSCGDWGPKIARNDTLRIALRTMTPFDGSSTVPGLRNVDTTKLRDHTMMVQPSIEEPRVIPGKACDLEGDAIHAVAIRNAAWKPMLELEIASRLGEDYAKRWDADRLPELSAACRRAGFPWPVEAPDQGAVNSEFQAIAASLEGTMNPTDPSALPDPSEGIAELNAIAARFGQALPSPLQEIEELLRAENAPTDWVSTSRLAVALGRVDPSASEEEAAEAARVLGNELNTLCPNLRSRLRRGEGSRSRGYDVARLRAATAAMRAGEELPAEAE